MGSLWFCSLWTDKPNSAQITSVKLRWWTSSLTSCLCTGRHVQTPHHGGLGSGPDVVLMEVFVLTVRSRTRTVWCRWWLISDVRLCPPPDSLLRRCFCWRFDHVLSRTKLCSVFIFMNRHGLSVAVPLKGTLFAFTSVYLIILRCIHDLFSQCSLHFF